PQGYFQVDLGTSGDRIGVSFELVGRPSQVTELSLSGVSREAFNTFGHFYDLAPGQTYTLRLWATNRSGGTTAMRWRQLEYVTFPSSGPRNRMERTDTVLVSTATTEVDQPINFLLVDGNRWTKLHEFQIPAAAGDFNWTGEGYVEILGRGEDALGTNAGDWTSTAVDLAVEVITGDGKNVDMHLVGFSLPPGHHGRYFFIDAMLWGAGTGNTVKLWMRKAHSSGTFRVAKRHMALKLVPFAEPTDTNTCWYYNPGP
ncbi:MAG TPA: hypothetical protein VHK90_08680, partial [Thermoanaerobaculia bacterium]|nr:hypothetical protein [Thermoanaerobaculia bacterium]